MYALAAQARRVSQGNTDNLDLSLVCNDARAANLSILFERYYGENTDPLDGLMTDGKLKGHFVNLQRQVGFQPPWCVTLCLPSTRSQVAAQRARGCVTVSEAFGKLCRYLEVCKLINSRHVKNNSFRSDKLLQVSVVIYY